MEIENSSNGSNTTCTKQPDELKAWTLLLILFGSVIANVCTITLITRFKVRRVPDILVIGLAVSDLFAVCIPVVISVFEYFNPCVDTSGTLCYLFATLAHFTRYSSALIVSVVSVERYFAVNRPFVYRTYIGPYPYRCVIVLFACWFVAGVLAIVPAVFPTDLTGGVARHEGYCLFYLQSKYAIAVLIYAVIQYGVVCICFMLVAKNLVKVYRRRKRMTSRGTVNQNSQAKGKPHEVIFIKPKLTSRISDLGKSLKTGISEKFQLGVEAEFGRMFFMVVLFFYITWTTIVVLIIIAQITGTEDGLEEALFWGIRLTVASTLVNPLLYGIFARQYRTGYLYVMRLCLSKIFTCVNPPVKNIFASSDLQSEARHDTRRYDQRPSGSSEPVLVRSRATTFTTLPSIQDVQLVPDFLADAVTGDCSLHSDKAGDQSSTAIIPPHRLQDSLHQIALPRRSHSLDGVIDSEQHYCERVLSTNKLALLLNGTRESTVVNEDDLIETDMVFHNPVYEHSSHNDIASTNPSLYEQGGQTPSDTGSTDFLVQRSPIISRGNNGSTRERANTSPCQFEVPSLCTVVASFKPSERSETGIKSVNYATGFVSPTDSTVSPTVASLTGVTSQTESITVSEGIGSISEHSKLLPLESLSNSPPTQTFSTSPPTEPMSTSASTEPMSTSPPTEPMSNSPSTEPMSTSPSTEPMSTSASTEPMSTSPPTEPMSTSPSTEPMSTSPPTEPMSTSPPTEPMSTSPSTENLSNSLPTQHSPPSDDLVSNDAQHTVPTGTDSASLLTSPRHTVPTGTDSASLLTSPRVKNTIVNLQQTRKLVKPTEGRRESATRELGSKTIQELKRQFEAAKVASPVLEAPETQ